MIIGDDSHMHEDLLRPSAFRTYSNPPPLWRAFRTANVKRRYFYECFLNLFFMRSIKQYVLVCFLLFLYRAAQLEHRFFYCTVGELHFLLSQRETPLSSSYSFISFSPLLLICANRQGETLPRPLLIFSSTRHSHDKMSTSIITVILILCAPMTTAIQVPFIPNAAFVPISSSNSTTVTNRSCDQCLCDSNASHMILNCFPNNTCQFFVDAPRIYQLQPTANCIVYFPRQILPNDSDSCTTDADYLLNQLNAATPTYASVSQLRSLLLDNHDYLVTVSIASKSIRRFYSNNLTSVSQPPSPIFSENPNMIAYHDGAYYVGFDTYILVFDSTNMSQIHNIGSSSLQSIRDIIFLSDGQLMIVVCIGNSRLVFFNRSSSMPHNYDFIGFQTVTYPVPHGLFYGNDTFFYLTSWS